jgi:hypothetical protein
MVFVPTNEADFAPGKGAAPRLLARKKGAFNATNEHWSLGLPSMRGDKVHLLYFSHVAPRSESLPIDEAVVLGRAYGVYVDGDLVTLGGA